MKEAADSRGASQHEAILISSDEDDLLIPPARLSRYSVPVASSSSSTSTAIKVKTRSKSKPRPRLGPVAEAETSDSLPNLSDVLGDIVTDMHVNEEADGDATEEEKWQVEPGSVSVLALEPYSNPSKIAQGTPILKMPQHTPRQVQPSGNIVSGSIEDPFDLTVVSNSDEDDVIISPSTGKLSRFPRTAHRLTASKKGKRKMTTTMGTGTAGAATKIKGANQRPGKAWMTPFAQPVLAVAGPGPSTLAAQAKRLPSFTATVPEIESDVDDPSPNSPRPSPISSAFARRQSPPRGSGHDHSASPNSAKRKLNPFPIVETTKLGSWSNPEPLVVRKPKSSLPPSVAVPPSAPALSVQHPPSTTKTIITLNLNAEVVSSVPQTNTPVKGMPKKQRASLAQASGPALGTWENPAPLNLLKLVKRLVDRDDELSERKTKRLKPVSSTAAMRDVTFEPAHQMLPSLSVPDVKATSSSSGPSWAVTVTNDERVPIPPPETEDICMASPPESSSPKLDIALSTITDFKADEIAQSELITTSSRDNDIHIADLPIGSLASFPAEVPHPVSESSFISTTPSSDDLLRLLNSDDDDDDAQISPLPSQPVEDEEEDHFQHENILPPHLQPVQFPLDTGNDEIEDTIEDVHPRMQLQLPETTDDKVEETIEDVRHSVSSVEISSNQNILRQLPEFKPFSFKSVGSSSSTPVISVASSSIDLGNVDDIEIEEEPPLARQLFPSVSPPIRQTSPHVEEVHPAKQHVCDVTPHARQHIPRVSPNEWHRLLQSDGSETDTFAQVEAILGKPSSPKLEPLVPFSGPSRIPPAELETEQPISSRRGLANRVVDTTLINEWNKRLHKLTQNPELHCAIFEAYIALATSFDEPDASEIKVVNKVDREGAPPDFEFQYSNVMLYSPDVPDPELSKGCDCEGPCNPESKTCSCVRRQELYFYDTGHKGFAYNEDGTIKQEDCAIWECGSTCGCPPECWNRVIQRGRNKSTRLEIFKTREKGWGVRTKVFIPRGRFLGVYSGEMITEAESERRGQYYEQIGRTYLFDLDGYHIQNPPEGLAQVDIRAHELAQQVKARAQKVVEVEDDEFCYSAYSVDAFHYGFTRFFNHSCNPNLVITQAYVYDFHPERPMLVILARRDISSGEELCISYKGVPDDILPIYQTPGLAARQKGRGGASTSGKGGRKSKSSALAHVTPTKKISTGKDECRCGALNCDGKMFSTGS